MSQPTWEYVTNLGDASPIDNGGLFVYRDTTGVYGYELEKLAEPLGDMCSDDLPNVPEDWPVQPFYDDEKPSCFSTCGTCKRRWDNGVSTSITPTPGGRCPFESYHATDTLRWTIHRVCLDRCKEVRSDDGSTVYLVPYSYQPDWPHPVKAYVEWFSKDLAGVASFVGTSREELVTALCSEDGIARASAYQSIYDYHGWENGDSYPSTLTRAEVEARYTGGEL